MKRKLVEESISKRSMVEVVLMQGFLMETSILGD